MTELEWRGRRSPEPFEPADPATPGEPAGSSDDPDPELSVVVPAYNEREGVEAALATLEEDVAALVDSFEIVIVDDGSDDGTTSVLQSLAESHSPIEYVRHGTNHGKGQALRTGCRAVTGDRVLFIDADGDLDPGEVSAFVEVMDAEDADIVIGSKRHPDSEVDYPLVRTVLSKGYSAVVRVLFGLAVTDTQVGMKLLRRELVDEVMPLLLVKRYAFDVELLAVAASRGYAIAEAPVSLHFTMGSHVDWSTVARMAWDTAAVFYRLRLLRYYDRVDATRGRGRG